MATKIKSILPWYGMTAVLTLASVVVACTSEQAESNVRRMVEQGSVTFLPSMAATGDWGRPDVDDWGTTRGSRYKGDIVEGQSYTTLKTSDTFHVSGYRYAPSKGETVGSVSEPNFFENTEVGFSDGEWRATDNYYVPTADERTDFFAWFVPDGTEGISLNSDQSGTLRLDYALPTGETAEENTTLLAKHPDLMTAATTDEAYSDVPGYVVPLTFSHQLTEVNFVVGEVLSPGTITEIAFTNVGTQGTLSVSNGEWAVNASPSETAFALNFDVFNGEERRTGETILGGLMMIPQTFDNANQRIRMKMTVDGSPYTVYADLYSAEEGAQNSWRPGQSVTYTVSSATLPQLLKNTLTVAEAELSMHLDKSRIVAVTENTSGGQLSVVSSNPEIATAEVADGKITITSIAEGEATITLTSKETKLYAEASREIAVKVERGILLSEATSAHIGWAVCSEGYIHENAASVEYGSTALAMVAYIGSASNCTHGLAIALEDASSNRSWNAATSNNDVGKWAADKAVPGGSWRMPTLNDWKYMFQACGGSTYNTTMYDHVPYSCGDFVTYVANCGGEEAEINTSTSHMSSSSSNGSGIYYTFRSQSFYYSGPSNTGYIVRAVLVF